MSFLEFMEICSDIFTSGITFFPDVLKTFTTNLGEDIIYNLQFFFDIPLIGVPLQSLAESLVEPLSDVTLLNLMFGSFLPFVLIYSFVKWLVGIVTGS